MESQQDSGEVTVWCLAQAQYDQLIIDLQTPPTRHVVPDYLTLPYYPGDWTVAANDNGVLIRYATHQGCTQQHGLCLATLQALIQSHGLPQRLHLVSSHHEILNDVRDWAKSQTIESVNESHQLPYLQQLPTDMTLLATQHQPKVKSSGLTAATITLAVCAIAYIGIQIGSHLFQNTVYRNANHMISQQLQRFKNTQLPASLRQLSVTQLQQRVNQISANQHNRFSSLSQQLGTFLHQHAKLTLNEMHFNGKTLTAIVAVPDAQSSKDTLSQLPASASGKPITPATATEGLKLSITFKGTT